jgi:putative DNA primase/helicase
MSQQSLEHACIDACISIGVQHKNVKPDGEWYTTSLIDDPKNKGNGRIKVFPDLAGGLCFNWVTGQSATFFVDRVDGGVISEQDRIKIEDRQHKRKAELITKQNKAAKKALSLWVSAKPAPPDHPYLKNKRVKPYLTRQANWTKNTYIDDKWQKLTIKNVLLVPLYNAAGIIRNVQAIFPEKNEDLCRNKDFLAGAELSGLFSWVGDKTDTVCIAEGLATSHTVNEKTGFRVYVAFTANNLLAVGQTIRKHLPNATIIFTADNDKSCVGLEKATEAAKAVNGHVCMPPIVGMDFNDYANYLQDAEHDE